MDIRTDAQAYHIKNQNIYFLYKVCNHPLLCNYIFDQVNRVSPSSQTRVLVINSDFV